MTGVENLPVRDQFSCRMALPGRLYPAGRAAFTDGDETTAQTQARAMTDQQCGFQILPALREERRCYDG